MNKKLNFYIHPTSFLDENISIGNETKIWHFSHILKNCSIGIKCSLGQNVVVGPNVVIGNNVKIQNNVSVYEGVTLEDDVFCGPSCVFTNVINPRSIIERKNEFKNTLVKRGASIGANSTILCGLTIGEYSFIGAGSVVTKDVNPFSIIVGNPGKHIGWISKSGATLKSDLICPIDGSVYELSKDNKLFLK